MVSSNWLLVSPLEFNEKIVDRNNAKGYSSRLDAVRVYTVSWNMEGILSQQHCKYNALLHETKVHADALSSAVAKGNPCHAGTWLALSFAAWCKPVRIKTQWIFPDLGVAMETVNIDGNERSLWDKIASQLAILCCFARRCCQQWIVQP